MRYLFSKRKQLTDILKGTPGTSVFKFRRPNSASSRVILLPELLEDILSYLSSTRDIMAAYTASPIFQICIFQSPRLKMRDLWLHPKKVPLTWYKWSWQKLDEDGFRVEEVKLVPRPNIKTADMEFTCQLAPTQPATLCPLAHLWNLDEERLPKGFQAADPPSCTVGIIATPSELELYGDMIFTDPPVYEACAKLWYSHNKNRQCYITGERTVKSEFPLTVRGFLDTAFRMRGEISVHDVECEAHVAGALLQDTSFEEVICEWIRQLGGHFDLVFNRSPVCFKGVSILRSDEWISEEKKFAEQVREAMA
jgi:hypothetical protein